MKKESVIKLSELLKEHQLQCCVVPGQQECTFTYNGETGITTFDFNFSENKTCRYLVDFSILNTTIAGQCVFYLIRTDQYYSPKELELLANNNANLNNVISHYGLNNSIPNSRSQFKNATYHTSTLFRLITRLIPTIC